MKKICIVPKISKLEWDMHRLRISKKKLIEFYNKQGFNPARVLKSHARQKEGLKKLKALIPGAKIISRNSFNSKKAKHFDLIIAYGGDNHFLFVSHALDKTPILGINSDPTTSEGVLTSTTINDVEKVLPKVLNEKLKSEYWTRLKIYVNGKPFPIKALSEIFIGEESRFNMSRHILYYKGVKEEQKGSGMLIATGAGSTGWYNSAGRYVFPKGDIFPNTKKEARFLLTEPYTGRISKYKNANGKFTTSLNLTSLSDSSPFLSIDSLEKIPLPEGAKIKIKLGSPLKVRVI